MACEIAWRSCRFSSPPTTGSSDVDLEVVRAEDRRRRGWCRSCPAASVHPAGRDVGVVALAGLERVVRGVGVGRRAEGDLVEAVGPGLAVDVAGPLVVLDEHDLLVGARLLELVRPVADHQAVLPLVLVVRSSTAAGIGQNSWKPATVGEVRVRRGQRDREGHGVVVGVDAGDGVGLAVELLLATFDEAEQVAVVTGEVGVEARSQARWNELGRISSPSENVWPSWIVKVHTWRRRWPRTTRPRAARSPGSSGSVESMSVRPSYSALIDLVGVERGVQRRVDVLRRVTDEGAEVDELAARFACRVSSRLCHHCCRHRRRRRRRRRAGRDESRAKRARTMHARFA